MEIARNAPARTRNRGARERLLTSCFAALVVAAALGIVLLVTYPSRNLAKAQALAERMLGPLERDRFATDPSCADPADLGELALRTRLSEDEYERLRELQVPGDEGGPSLDWSEEARSRNLDELHRFREAIRAMDCLHTSSDDPSSPIPDGSGSIVRLHLLEFVHGLASIEDDDPGEFTVSVCSLGESAQLLQSEANMFYQLLGLQAERRQLTLIAEALRAGIHVSSRQVCLVDNDLLDRSRDMVALESFYVSYWMPGEISEQLAESGGSGSLARGWTQRLFLDLTIGKALQRNVLVWQAFDVDIDDQKELVDYDNDDSRWSRWGMLAGIKDWTLGARYHSLDYARQATRFVLARQASEDPCVALDQEEVAIGLELVNGQGGCVIELTLPGYDLLSEEVTRWVVPRQWQLPLS